MVTANIIISMRYIASMKLRVTHHTPAYWRVTFDNPPLNLLDPEVTYELRDLINQMEITNELKVIVFDSANPDFYIGHVDLIRAGEFSTDVGPTGLRILPDFLQRLAHLPVISIASIRGRARGVCRICRRFRYTIWNV